jgi:hypothetical protein
MEYFVYVSWEDHTDMEVCWDKTSVSSLGKNVLYFERSFCNVLSAVAIGFLDMGV